MGTLQRFDLSRIRAECGIDELVETGSGQGDSLAWARASGISRCWSVELHPDLALRCQRRFASDSAVTVVTGDSREFLAKLPRSTRARLHFLDAHFAGGADFGLADYVVSAANEASFPLIDELSVLVADLQKRDLVIVDDARMYFERPFQNGECPAFARRWHERDALVGILARASATHQWLLLDHDEGYLALVPKPLAGRVATWLRPLPQDRVVPMSAADAATIELTPHALLEASIAALKDGRTAQARAGFEALRSNAELRPEASNLLGVVVGLEGNHERAAALFREAIALDRTRPDVFANLAVALERLGQHDSARTARSDIGVALHIAGRYRDAVVVFDRILADTPNHLMTLVDIAATLQELGEYRRALACGLRATYQFRDCEPRLEPLLEALRDRYPAETAKATREGVGPNNQVTGKDVPLLLPKALNNCGNSLVRIGDFDLGEACYAIAVALAPDEAIVQWNLSHVRLLRGDFAQGFALFESRWRWSGFNFPERNLPRPRWEGGSPAGQRLLVYAEQGFGDTIQFARLVPLLAARGATVWFEVQQELFWLLKAALRDVPRVEMIPRMTDPRAVYGDPAFDAHCAVMSLAKHLNVSLADLPVKTPYLTADAERVARWAATLGARHRPRVGVVWAGRPDHARDRERSLGLEGLRELIEFGGVEWISLQLGAARLQIAGASLPLRDLGDDLSDFGETAALIENLDLVVTVDTAVAHLAGAMGKPVWILLPFVPDWRWLLGRDDSPWYPTARLFRQQVTGGWAGVMRQVKAALLAEFPNSSLDDGATASARPMTGNACGCKICRSETRLLGVVDFAKNCLDPSGASTQRSGREISYYWCEQCGLTFTPAFDDWDFARFKREIYNEAYLQVDPDSAGLRPQGNVSLLGSIVNDRSIRILDYGGGNGRLATLMNERGFDCVSWDPLYDGRRPLDPGDRYDLVTAFEVFEHSPRPLESFAEAASLMKPGGALIFSTLMVESGDADGVNHWYIAPRNGHVSIYSRRSLDEMARRFGLQLRHLSEGLHVAWQQAPAWLRLDAIAETRLEATV